MKVNVIFTLDPGPDLPEDARTIFRGMTGEWTQLPSAPIVRLFDAVIEPIHIEPIYNILIDLNPMILGVWNQDGSFYDLTLYPHRQTEYLAAMPDVVVYDESGNEISRERPTVPSTLHSWSGWQEKSLT